MPTPLFNCSAYCGWSGTNGAAPGNAAAIRHISGATTGANVSVVTMDGHPAWQLAHNGTTRTNLFRDFPGAAGTWPTVVVFRAYIRFTVFPTVRIGILSASAVSNHYGIEFDPSDNALVATALAVSGGRQVISLNTTYRVDVRVNVSANPQTVECQINGVPLTTASRAAAATELDVFRWGLGMAGNYAMTAGATVQVWGIVVSHTSADYPFGAGKQIGLAPNADGTHSFNLASDFKYQNTTNVGLTPTDIWSYLDDTPDNTTDFISMHGAVGEYCEVQFGNLPSNVVSVNGLEVVSAHHSSGTAVNTQALWLRDGSSDGLCHDDADFSGAGVFVVSKQFATAPSGGALTKAKIDAMRARFGSSKAGSAIVSPVPFIDAILLEVDYVEAAAGPPYVVDSFTDTAGTLLDAHTGETGATWTRATGDGGGTAPIILSDGRLRPQAGSGTVSRWKPSGAALGADYVMRVDIYNPNAGAGTTGYEDDVSLIARVGGTLIAWSYEGANQDLYFFVGVTLEYSDTGTLAIPTGTTKQLKLEVEGGTARCYWDGVLKHTETGIAQTGTGVPALEFYIGSGTPNDATTLRVDNFRVDAAVRAVTASLAGVATVAATLEVLPASGIQSGVPDATTDAGGWSANTGTIHEALADPSTANYATSPTNPVNATLKVSLNSITTPGAGDVVIDLDVTQAP